MAVRNFGAPAVGRIAVAQRGRGGEALVDPQQAAGHEAARDPGERRRLHEAKRRLAWRFFGHAHLVQRFERTAERVDEAESPRGYSQSGPS